MSEPPANMFAWLHRIMRHHWFNVVRQRRNQLLVSYEWTGDGIDSSLVDMRASVEQLTRAWQQLSESARVIAEQCLIDDEGYDTVSERMGVKKTTLATSIHRTRLELKNRMFGAHVDEFEPPVKCEVA